MREHPIQLAFINKNDCADSNLCGLLSLQELKNRIAMIESYDTNMIKDPKDMYVVIRLVDDVSNEDEWDEYYLGLTGVEMAHYDHLELSCFMSKQIVSNSGDVHPEIGEYWKPIREYYQRDFEGEKGWMKVNHIAGFVTSETCGHRLRKMVEEVLGHKPSISRMHWQFEPKRVQFYFSAKEFNIQKLYNALQSNREKGWGIVTKEILKECKKK